MLESLSLFLAPWQNAAMVSGHTIAGGGEHALEAFEEREHLAGIRRVRRVPLEVADELVGGRRAALQALRRLVAAIHHLDRRARRQIEQLARVRDRLAHRIERAAVVHDEDLALIDRAARVEILHEPFAGQPSDGRRLGPELALELDHLPAISGPHRE